MCVCVCVIVCDCVVCGCVCDCVYILFGCVRMYYVYYWLLYTHVVIRVRVVMSYSDGWGTFLCL